MTAKETSDDGSLPFYAQGCVRKLAALLHAPGARVGEDGVPPTRFHTGTPRKHVSKS